MRERMVISVLLAVLVHFILLLVLQLFLKLEQSRIPEYSGPLYITLGETPEEAPVVQEPDRRRLLPRLRREQPQVDPSTAEPGDAASSQPHLRPAPLTAPSEEPSAQPQRGLRFLDSPPQSQPDAEALPPDPEGIFTPPARTESALPPIPDPPQPSQAEVRPTEEPDQSVLDLRSLDDTIEDSGSPGTRGEQGGSAAPAGSEASSAAAEAGSEGIVIEWDDPSQGRERTGMENPDIPDWVSEEGLRLQVVVSFELTPEGFLQIRRVEQSSGYSDVDSAVLEALRRWKFRPVSSTRTVTGRVTYVIVPN